LNGLGPSNSWAPSCQQPFPFNKPIALRVRSHNPLIGSASLGTAIRPRPVYHLISEMPLAKLTKPCYTSTSRTCVRTRSSGRRWAPAHRKGEIRQCILSCPTLVALLCTLRLRLSVRSDMLCYTISTAPLAPLAAGQPGASALNAPRPLLPGPPKRNGLHTNPCSPASSKQIVALNAATQNSPTHNSHASAP
jgi:hypothetical protein